MKNFWFWIAFANAILALVFVLGYIATALAIIINQLSIIGGLL